MKRIITEAKYHARILMFVFLPGIFSAGLAAQEGGYYSITRIPLSGRGSLAELIQDRGTPVDAKRSAMRRLRQLSREPGAAKMPAAEFYGPILKALALPGKDNVTLRETACEELGHFGKESGGTIPSALGRVLADKNETMVVRTAAARSLGLMLGNPAAAGGPLTNHLRAEVKAGPNATNIPLVRTIIKSLGQLRQTGSRSALLSVLDSRFPGDVKQSANKALENLPAK